MKSNHWVQKQNKVATNGAPVLAPNCSTTILAAKMCTNSHEHSLYISFLWNEWQNISELQECHLGNLEKSCRWDYVRNETFSISWKEEMFYDETISDGIATSLLLGIKVILFE
jgi:hypothetical protein